MREDDITGISQEFDLVLSRVMPPRGKGAQERDMEMANHHKMRPEAEVEERLEEKDVHAEEKRLRIEKTSRPAGGLLKPRDGYIAAFFVPVVIMIIIFAQRGIFPFGEESFLRTDMYHQYAPFFSEFRHKLAEGGSLLYSWDIGLGVNFAALYAYYLASPLNWLLILCPGKYVIEFMTAAIVLKIGLAGLSFTWYLRKRSGVTDFGACFFGIFYALSGYMAAYSWNIMWLDCIVLFPLIFLGLEQLVREKKGLLYCISLALSILSNYYISIMICMFMVIYFAVLMVLDWENFKDGWGKCIGLFAGCSLLAGGLAAVVLLPEIFALQSTASGEMSFPQTVESYFSIVDMLARHIGNVQVEIGLEHWPNIYCGTAVLMLFLLYLVCRNISLREKAVYCSLLLFFLASFSVNVLNFIWHGFHYPNSLPARQSFIYIALMLTVCFQAYRNLDRFSDRSILAAFLGAVSFVLLSQKFREGDEAYHFAVFYGAVFFLAVYAGLMVLYRRRGQGERGRKRAALAALLTLFTVCVEAAVNTTCTSVTTTSRTAYTADNEAVETLAASLKGSADFYRIEKTDQRTKNDGAWMHFPSVSLFSSMAHADVTEFMKSLGCEGSTNAYSITGSTPFVDCLLSVKYAFYPREQSMDRLEYVQDYQGTYLYANRYALPLGFMIPDIMKNEWHLNMANPADVQNSLCSLFDAPDVLQEETGLGNGPSLIYTPEEAGEYYAFVSNKQVKSVSLKKGEEKDTFDNINRGYLIEVGMVEAGETLAFQNEEGNEDLGIRLYRYNEAGLEHVYRKLAESPLTLSVWEDDRLKGTVDAGMGGTLFTSIPYDKGWTVTVDGQERQPQELFGAFLGIELEPGSHVIECSYLPEGLKEGMMISLFCVAVLAAAVFISRRRRQKERKAMRRRLLERRTHREEHLTRRAFERQPEEADAEPVEKAEAAGITESEETEKDINQET
ncbi:MAG: YfhO family protein [Clostridium sp.]